MTDSQFLIKKAIKLSIEGDRLFSESYIVNDKLKNQPLTDKASVFHERAKRLYDQAQEV